MSSTAAGAGSAETTPTTAPEPRVRSYPQEPRVGVGVVVLRQLTQRKEDAEVLLIRRAKEPGKGELGLFPLLV